MQKSDFYMEIEKYKDEENLSEIITKIAYNEILSKELKTEAFIDICGDLDSFNLLNKSNIKSIVLSYKKAITKDKEEKLINLLYEAEKIRKELIKTAKELGDESFESLKELEDNLSNQNLDKKEIILSAINEALVDVTISVDIVKEVSQNVFLSIIESGEDVEEVAFEFSKNLAYKTIVEQEFSQLGVLEISKSIISQALNVANVSQIYSYELIFGAVSGVEAGIAKAVEKIKNEFKFAPDEIAFEFEKIKKELLNLDEEFILVLKNLSLNIEDPAKKTLDEILKKEYDNYIVRMKKLSSDAIELIKSKISDIEISQNYKEFSKAATTKFEDIKKDLVAKSTKILDDFEINQKFENFKKELEESKFFSKFKSKKDTTKELSDRAFTASKDIVNENKEKNSQDKEYL